MTPQEIFDTVVTHCLKQGKPALNNDGHCAYRGNYGTKCAVGCLIPDEDYDPRMEGDPDAGGLGVGELVDLIDNEMPDLTNTLWYRDLTENLSLLYELQGLHDCFLDLGRSAFLHQAKEIATNHNLEWRSQ